MMTNPGSSHCGSCAGIALATPQPIDNPPGQPAIAYRTGVHATFKASLLARLSSPALPALAGLTRRDDADFSVALCDGLACLLDVLTFYQERIANECLLRTATERRSILELGRLIGYQLAPGVAAATHLAFELREVPGDAAQAPDPVTIPAGTRVQSVAGQDEQAQTFETVEAIEARVEWNALRVRTETPWQPQAGDTELWLSGAAVRLAPGDALLIVGAERLADPGSERWDIRVLTEVEADPENARTRLRWEQPLGSIYPPVAPAAAGVEVHVFRQRAALFGHNAPDPNLFGNADSNLAELIDTRSSPWHWEDFALDPDALDLDPDNPRITAGSWIALVSNVLGRGRAGLPGYTELYRAARVAHLTRSDFGLSAKVTRIRPDTDENLTAKRFDLRRTLVLAESESLAPAPRPVVAPVYGARLRLARRTEGLRPGRAIALGGPRQRLRIAPHVAGLVLAGDDGTTMPLAAGDELSLLAAPERLAGGKALALEPDAFDAAVGDAAVVLRLTLLDRGGRTGRLEARGSQVRLAAVGEDDPPVTEIAFIATDPTAVVHERDHTVLRLAEPLANVYARAELRINANCAAATHGETVAEIVGSGDAQVANARLALRQGPLTFVSASTPSGRRAALALRANDLLWEEVPSLYERGPIERVFALAIDEQGRARLRFGDGVEGARLPGGDHNVRAVYRKGLGLAGNLPPGRLTTLLSRPLGVSGVTNPAPATGGEDPETEAQARDNAPLTVRTLDRAVSVRDYRDFARAFAGIAKAHALWLAHGPARGLFITVAGERGAAVPEGSDTYRFLRAALTRYGDPALALRLASFCAATFRLGLAVKVADAADADLVLPALAARLGAAFGFAARDFGQGVSVDEVVAVAQSVAGVAAVHVAELQRSDVAEPVFAARLFAEVPRSGDDSPRPAELLTLDDAALALEQLP
ncbi:putative baseplate assembly protein [Thioflavicoccus mobilis]|nr:putative baseplate assembly protein [Thioflavicoccus mobilis]